MVLKITNLHILRYLPTCWLYLLECYTIDNQRCTHTASESEVEKPHGKKPLTIRKEKEKDTLGKATCDCPPAASVIDP